MAQQDFMTDQFLIAMPSLGDPNFHQTVTYICEHSEEGALGIIINRPLDVTTAELFRQLELKDETEDTDAQPLHSGGPVQQERGFVIHQPVGDWGATLKVNDLTGVTSSRDILEAMAQGKGPSRTLVALGYAGWGAGQLENEVAENAWLSTPADPRILFDTPANKRWEEAANLIGVDLRLLSDESGHA